MSSRGHFSNAMIQNFTQLIAARTGLHIRSLDRDALCKKIELRMKSLRLSSPETYYQLLDSYTQKSEGEWQELALLLTTLESYFFRDQGQFSLLRKHILPNLIEHRRKVQDSLNSEAKPSLRIWSAGCSTGEEPYSLAILLRELIPDWENWNISIIGTDINREALEKAKQAVYSSWSFRMVNPDIQRRYFTPIKTDWKLHENICRSVKFYSLNLMKDLGNYNEIDIRDIDLIICRNVFVYFEGQAIAAVLNNFYHTLRPGGYLLTGHAELQGQDLNILEVQVFPESVIYKRRDDRIRRDYASVESSVIYPQKQSLLPLSEPVWEGGIKVEEQIDINFQLINATNLLAQATLKRMHQPKGEVGSRTSASTEQKTIENLLHILLGEAKALFQKEAYAEALKKAKQVLTLQPKHLDAHFLIAQLYANLGNYDQAIHYCQRALEIDPLSAIESYYLLAHIAEEKGDLEEAKIALKRILYLAPSSIYAYLELGFIYEREGDQTRANKMRTIALEMLNKLPANTAVEPHKKLTAGELIKQVRKILNS